MTLEQSGGTASGVLDWRTELLGKCDTTSSVKLITVSDATINTIMD